MERAHEVDQLEGRKGDGRAAWIQQSRSLLLRGLGHPEAYRQIGLDLLIEHAREALARSSSHSWSAENNALLALLSGHSDFFGIYGPRGDRERSSLSSEAVDAAKQLVEMGYDPRQSASFLGGDALDYAFLLNAPALVEAWSDGADIPNRKILGKTWLHAAAESSMQDMCQLLVKLGMDPNLPDELGNTPIFYAPNASTIACLRGLGADPSHRNHEKIDARTYIRSERKLSNDELIDITKAIGGVQVADDRAAIIAQFEAIADTGSGKALREEAQIIGLPGDARFSDGSSLIGQAVRRYLPSFCIQTTSKDRQKAVGWLNHCSSWEDALRAASEEDLARLWVLGDGSGHTAWKEGAEKEMARRGLECGPLLQAAALFLMEDQNARKNKKKLDNNYLEADQAKRLLQYLLAEPSDHCLDSVIWGLGGVGSSFKPPSAELAQQLSAQPQEWAGWKNKHVLDWIVDISMCNMSPNPHISQQYTSLIGRFFAQVDDNSKDLLRFLGNIATRHKQKPHVHLLTVELENARLLIETPSAPARRSSVRL